MYNKGDIIRVEISDMGKDGEGIGKIDTFPFFIKDTVTGDVVDAIVMKSKKNYAFAKLKEIVKPSPDRVTPPCPVAKSCGGCRIMEMSYEAQLRYKQSKVTSALCHIGGLDEAVLERITEPILGMEDPFRYRNKSIYPVAPGKDGRILSGFFASRTHSVIECDECIIGIPENSVVRKTVLKWMKEYGAEPYDEKNGSGLVRDIFIRKAFVTGELQVCLITTAGKLPAEKELVSALKEIPGMVSICLCVNNRDSNVILGDELHVLYGREWIEDELMGLKFRISPLSFYQVNPVQTKHLYETALEFADLKGGERVWDICCGIGTITLAAADRLRSLGGGHVLGLEIVPRAVENAKENAALNGFDDVEFVCAPAEKYLPEYAARCGVENKPDVVIADPPRAGLEREVVDALLFAAPEKIVYVSCDPATLARDAALLTAGGYEPLRVRAVDMFAHSSHIETCMLFKRSGI